MNIGDIVKGLSDDYGVTNTKMTKAVVLAVVDNQINIKVIEHAEDINGIFKVNSKDFEVIGHVKEFDRDKVLEDFKANKRALLEYDLRRADLSDADLRRADLSGANLSGADLRRADLDFSALPLRCGGLDVNIDDRQAVQLLYHLIRNVKYSKNTSGAVKQTICTDALIELSNDFHRISECGYIDRLETKEND